MQDQNTRDVMLILGVNNICHVKQLVFTVALKGRGVNIYYLAIAT